MGLRLHPREMIVTEARMNLERRVLDWRQEMSETLTDGEELAIVNEVLSRTIGGIAKYQIRFERHGNYDTPGGEA